MVDLTEDFAVPIRLLNDPYSWRVRAVEKIQVVSARTCSRRRSLQVAPLLPTLSDVVPADTDRARIVLPVASWPKGPVHDFDVEVNGGSAHVIPRVDIADIEASYLVYLATEAGLTVPPTVKAILPLLLGFTTGPWEQWLRDFDNDPKQALLPYLRDGIGPQVSQSVLTSWHTAIGSSQTLISERQEDASLDLSAVANPILAAPELIAAGISTLNEVEEVICHYADFVAAAGRAATSAGGPSVPEDLLRALADYGHYWDLMVTAEVPLDAPFTIKTCESRALGLDQIRQQAAQQILISDAATNHVTLTVADNNVEIVEPVVKSLAGDDLSFLTAARTVDPEGASFYLSEYDRDYRALIVFRLRPTPLVQAVNWSFVLLVVVSLVALLSTTPVSNADLSVLVIPSTFAASLLLVREATTLGTSLRSRSVWALLIALAVLWVVVGALYLGNKVAQ